MGLFFCSYLRIKLLWRTSGCMLGVWYFRFRRTTILMVACAAFLLGLVLARQHLELSVAWIVITGLLTFAVSRQKNFLTILVAALFCLCLGWYRGQGFLQQVLPYQDLSDQRVVMKVVAESDGAYNDRGQLEFDAGNIEVIDPEEIHLPGRIKVAGFGVPAVFRNDIVEVEGKLYETRGSRQASIGFAEIRVLEHQTSFIDTIRRKFSTALLSVLPEPHASFGLGILIGQRNTLPDDTLKALSVVGLTHIIAVSGYNLTILVRFVQRLSAKRSKYQTVLFAGLLITTFLLITGLSASIVRAAIVSGLGLLAWYYGRNFRPVLLLLLTAAATAGWNPLYIWSDIGWYLSFLAFYGVLVLAPMIVKRYWGDKEPKLLTSVVLETMCAQVMTVPIILYIFNQLSLVSIVSNAIVVPLVPIAMVFTLIAGLGGLFMGVLAGLIAFPAKILLTYILDVASLISRIPGALVPVKITMLQMFILYVLLIGVSIVLWRKTMHKYGRITEIEAS
ncbi:MAG: hypothetical protein JWL85_466 [Candidatus Saccharibacteria bacterium]|nr:hypothetical protein [Candidatus Saccharibacteria bacterium]